MPLLKKSKNVVMKLFQGNVGKLLGLLGLAVLSVLLASSCKSGQRPGRTGANLKSYNHLLWKVDHPTYDQPLPIWHHSYYS